MKHIAAALASAALAGVLAACASQPAPSAPAPVASTPPTPAQQAAAPGASAGIDGTYRAPAGGATGNSACGTTRFGYPIRVANGVASMQTVSQGQLQGPVGPDGSLNIQNGRAALSGQFSGGKFTGNYNVGRCGFAMNYTK
jgi:hypothetical protein